MERLSVKARQPKQAEQRRRRAELLERQRSRRADRTAQNRGLGDGGDAGGGGGCGHAEWMGETDGGDASAPMLDTSEPLPAGAGDDAMQTEGGGGGGRRRRPAGREAALMAPEWMVDVPEDLPSCWSVVARPAGVRCLVTTGGGETRRHAKGCAPRRFPSALPGGRRAAGGAGHVQLDCVWAEAEQTYYVLDLLAWKGLRLVDHPYEERVFWAASKLAEVHADRQASTNPCRFVHLPPSGRCSAATLSTAYYRGGGASRDGLLFYHNEGLYEAGPSPLLLLWSDASCSSRFYDYGSAQMARELAAAPDKAARWRPGETEAALPIGALLAACEGAMEADSGAAAGR